MKMTWQLMLTAAALAVTLGAVNACSDDSEAVGQATTTTATSAETASTVAASSASEPLTVTEQEEGSGDADDEFIELAYFEILDLGDVTLNSGADTECDRSDPDIEVCPIGWTTTMRTTIIGEIYEVASGTNTTYASESCTNPSGETVTRAVTEIDGTMTAKWGDEIYFSKYVDSCTDLAAPGFFEFTGGTGRFLDAHGRISQMTYGELLPGANVSAGTLNVRGDLWDPVFPPAD